MRKVNNPVVIKDLLDEAGCRYKQNSKSYILPCPKCRKNDKLYIRKMDGRFVCWYCSSVDGFQGSPEYALSLLTNLPIVVLREKLYGFSSVELSPSLDLQLRDFMDSEDEIEEPEPYTTMLSVTWPLTSFAIDSEQAIKGANYLQTRGIPTDVAAQYGIRYDIPSMRVLFPVEFQGALLGWQGRYIGNSEEDNVPKALTSKGLSKNRIVMFADKLINSEHCILCEGPIDALKANLCGGNVATMGKAVSAVQLDFIRKRGVKKVYLALDPDAYREANKLLKQLGDMEVYDMRPPDKYSDIGEMPMDEVYSLFKSAPRVTSSYLFVNLKPPSAYG